MDELITGEAVALDVRAAGFVLRAAGAAIDVIVYLVLFVGLMLLAFSALESLGLGGDEATGRIVMISGLVTCIVVVPVAVELLSRGRSLGKLAVGARIVRDDGGAIGFRHAFIRALTGVIELFMTLGGIAALVGLTGARAKRLGDHLAGTYAQYERPPKATEHVFGVPEPLRQWATVADVARLPAPLARRIAQFLKQANGHLPESRRRLSSELAAEAAHFVSPLPHAEPELFLAAVATIRRDRESAALRRQARTLERLQPALKGLPPGFPDR